MAFLNISNLLYFFLVILILILLVILLSIFLKKEVVKEDRPLDLKGKKKRDDQYSLYGLLQTRVTKGVEPSIQYASNYQAKIIDDRASMVDYVDFDNNQEQNKIILIGNKLQEYLDAVNETKIAYPPEEPDLFLLLSYFNRSNTNTNELFFLYDYLLAISKSLKENNLLFLVTLLSKFKYSALAETNIECRQFNLFFESFVISIKASKKNIDNLKSNNQKDRQFAIKKIKEGIRDSASVFAKINGNKIIPEIRYYKFLLKEIKEIVINAEVNEAWKPNFKILPCINEEKICIETDTISLDFNIVNSNYKLAPVKRIEVQSLSLSNDIVTDGEKHFVNINAKGKGFLTILFKSYASDACLPDQEPIIRFFISFSLLAYKKKQEILITLPPIEIKRKIFNPFHDGKGGKALSGDSNLFTGRSKILFMVSRDLLNFDTTSFFYLFYGHPRSGKTSIIRQLSDNPKWLKNRYAPLWTSAEDTQDISSYYEYLYDRIKEILLNEMGLLHVNQPVDKKRYKKMVWARVIDLLRKNREGILNSGKKILIIIDEYQRLVSWDQIISDEIIIERDDFHFPEFIKILRDQYDDLACVILDGQQSIDQISTDSRLGAKWGQKLGGRISEVEVRNLSEKEADELILKQFGKFDIIIERNILSQIRNYSACHAWLHILIGYYLFERIKNVIENRECGQISVSENDVDNAAQRINGSDIKFVWVEPWLIEDYSAKIILAGIGKFSYIRAFENNNLAVMPELSVDDLTDFFLLELDINPKYFEFEASISKLKKFGILKSVQKNTFKLVYPLYALYENESDNLHGYLKKEHAG